MAEFKGDSLLTTQDVADLLGVAARSVSNWVEAGALAAAKTPGGHRRITPTAVLEFVRDRGLPIPEELAHLARPSVLIVDDNEPFLKSMERCLRSYDIEVHTANDGINGLVMIGELTPALVLLDVVMPGMDGIEVCRRLREKPSTAKMKIAVITAHARGKKEKALEAGADVFLQKPISAAVILGLLGIERGK